MLSSMLEVRIVSSLLAVLNLDFTLGIYHISVVYLEASFFLVKVWQNTRRNLAQDVEQRSSEQVLKGI